MEMTRRDRWIPWYFVAFFVVIALVDGAMVTIAIRTHTGLVTDHPYEKGLSYNRVVKAKEMQETYGWKGDIAYTGGRLSFTLHDKDGRLIQPQHATATITRPTQAGMDFTVALAGGGVDIDFPAKGLWHVRIDGVYDGVHYQQSRRIVIE